MTKRKRANNDVQNTSSSWWLILGHRFETIWSSWWLD